MSVATSTALIIGGGLAAAGAVGSSVIGSNAATTAANQQATADQNALNFQQQVFKQTQANQAPFVGAGQGSINTLNQDIQNGTFGPGSLPQFQLPTLAQAEQTPGYQFNLEQGNKGILQGAAAAGGAISGGTLKSLANYDTGLASTTYQQQVGNALSAYQALLSGQQQQYNQIANVASLGENAAANVGNQGVATGAQVGQTLGALGTAQASGTVGAANAITGGIGSISNLAQFYSLLNAYGQNGGNKPDLSLNDPTLLNAFNAANPAMQGNAAVPNIGGIVSQIPGPG